MLNGGFCDGVPVRMKPVLDPGIRTKVEHANVHDIFIRTFMGQVRGHDGYAVARLVMPCPVTNPVASLGWQTTRTWVELGTTLGHGI